MAKKQAMSYLKVKTFEDNWRPFHGHFSTFAQTKIPTKMDSKNPNSRAFEGLCSKYPQFQKYLKQYIFRIKIRNVILNLVNANNQRQNVKFDER